MFRWIVLLSVALWMAACSDDTTKGTGERPTCEFGERYNPITGTCTVVATNPNNTSSNNATTPNNMTNPNNTTNPNNITNPNNPDPNNQNNTSNNMEDMGQDMDPDPPDMPMLACGKGRVLGIACTPSGDLLAAADVTITGTDCATGQPFTLETRTNADGNYEFDDVPSGAHNLNISVGSFSGDSGVFVRAGETTDLTAAVDKVCLDAGAVKIAVIGGAYDAVEELLTGLNLTFDMKGNDAANSAAATAFLTNPAEMANYDIIFINCGDLYERLAPLPIIGGPDQRPAMVTNLRNFVDNGGSVYASDYAFPWIELAFPDVLEMYGAQGAGSASKMGFAPQTVTADVQSMDLQQILGSTTATIAFPHNPLQNIINIRWVVLSSVGNGAINHINADVALCNANCDAAGPTNADTPLLVTWKSPTGGTVVFTSFHNKRQATLNQDMELILRYLIFQL